ncbi:hypothetical protein F443_02824 [Phytophthora nicotianae P1569]|uniref:Ubiquitin-like protease family profile domain-containing protein n=1 Tax=Phytophthora nicotianae P1569 TaxID=1317065 RepID=V9FV99_PHYNI|nr:hypothetical protein F443_02824 [Phytophthora nicotianae P1569]
MKHFDSLQVEFGSSDESQLDPESRSLDPELVQSATEMGTESTELDNSAVENDRRARAVDLDDGKDEFELQSSPKAKGRPKQKPKAVKAKRNMNIAMVQEDIVMNEKQLSLLSVFELLADDATFNSAQENILQFKLFIFAKKPKPPIAHEIMKLPTLKPLARPDEIVRIFPMDLSKKCGVEVTAYQRNNNDVRELDIALEIIISALAWIEKVYFSSYDNTSDFVEADPPMPSTLKEIEVLTPQVDVLALAGKEVITDEVMHKILTKLLGFKPNIAIFDSSTLGIVVDGSVSTSNEIIREALAGVTNEKVLIPVNCNGNQWCAIIMYLAGGVVHVYDSSSSSYLVSVRAVAQKMIVLLPPHVQKKTIRVRTFEAGLGVQSDSYNCGIYDLIAFETFAARNHWDTWTRGRCSVCGTVISVCVNGCSPQRSSTANQ